MSPWMRPRRRPSLPPMIDIEELAHAISWNTGVDLGSVLRVLVAEEKLLIRVRVTPRLDGTTQE